MIALSLFLVAGLFAPTAAATCHPPPKLSGADLSDCDNGAIECVQAILGYVDRESQKYGEWALSCV